MNIVIVGAGKVGETLCRDLSDEGSNIFLIEIDENRIDDMMEIADITGIVGSGANYDILKEAQVEYADIFIAVTDSDELNIIACIMAKKIGAKDTIARVRSPEYAQNMEFVRRDLGISMMINPELESSKKILDTLKFPSANSVDTFMDGEVNIAEFEVLPESPLIGKALKELDNTRDKILVVTVDRDGEVTIPNGDFIFQECDRIYVTGDYVSIHDFIVQNDYHTGNIKSALIIGGSQMSYYLVERLLKKRIHTKLIEINEKRARWFSDEFPKLVVIRDDGTDHDVLQEQRMDTYDAVIACTGIDEENIILSMYAKSQGVEKNVTKVSRDVLYPIAEQMNIDNLITPKKVIADVIVKFVRSQIADSGSQLVNLHRLLDGEVEAIHFKLDKDSNIFNKRLLDIKLKENTLIACIRRDGKIIYPGGNDHLEKDDDILVITKIAKVEEFDDILVL